ncbi:hypothetical protein [Kitasatospora sp. NPDC059160]|uniref:hypothetical protein n=1 Tax=Kitasatospora sp. NPDC059160 TaxID=3346748 RepID=UPI00368F204B
MHTIMPGPALRAESAMNFSAAPVASTDELQELAVLLGVDLFAFADDLIDESAGEKAARLDAARDMLAEDPVGLYLGEVAVDVELDRQVIPFPAQPTRTTDSGRAAA